jgi:dihydrofolate reductase
MTKVILYIALSQDGFLADENGCVDWLPNPDDKDESLKELQDNHKKFMDSVSAIVMGRKSYEQTLSFGEWQWKDKQTYVFTSQDLTSPHPYITFVQDTPKEFMEKIKSNPSEGDIWLFGGAALAKSFSDERLINEAILTIAPVELGKGLPLEIKHYFYMTHMKPFSGGWSQTILIS